ncbi:MAG: NAD(P)/FAD-dependent oxidoreductase [Dehalococcoidia bacterium]
MDADVIVIGGGPAGSTAATLLARKGHRVLLLERERFPRDHIGESLLPASMPILEALGVMPAIQAEGFLKKYGATMVWGSGSEPWSWYFRETNKTHEHAYQVWRPRFDQILLDNSASTGVDVRQGCRVLEVDLPGQDRMTVQYTDGRGAAATATCRFVVDASGQAGLIGRKLGLRKADENFQNLAVYAYFEGCERLPPPDETNIFIESYEHGWFWMIPLHNGQMSVGSVVDHRYGSEAIRANGPEAYFAAQVAAAPNASRMLANARLVQGPTVIRDWSYSSTEVAGDGWVLAGDAACFIDPLFSTGVHLALSAGVMSAAYVETALKDRDLAHAAAPVYKRLYDAQYNLFRQLAGLFYATNRTIESYFWDARRIMGFDESVSARDAFIRAVAGQPPRGYEQVVLDRGEAPGGLKEGVEAVVAGRAERKERFATLSAASPGAEPAVLDLVPVLAPDIRVERQPVLGEGEFEWGYVVASPARPDWLPVSAFVARLVAAADGRRSVRQLILDLARESAVEPASIARPAVAAIGILYADGLIDELAPGAPA